VGSVQMVSDVRRPDFNQSLVYLTRERVERSESAVVTRVVRPFDVLKEILASAPFERTEM